MARDIFCLEKHRPGLLCPVLNNKRRDFRADTDNVIYTKGQDMTLSFRGNLECHQCKKETQFIHTFVEGKNLCPSCAAKTSPFKHCDECKMKQWCDTCGGRSTHMVSIKTTEHGNLLLCDQDNCLMPFGFCSRSVNSMVCDCQYHVPRKLYEKLPGDLVPIVLSYTTDKNSMEYVLTFKETIISDLTTTDKNDCIPCQIKTKYSLPDSSSRTHSFCLCNMDVDDTSGEESDYESESEEEDQELP